MRWERVTAENLSIWLDWIRVFYEEVSHRYELGADGAWLTILEVVAIMNPASYPGRALAVALQDDGNPIGIISGSLTESPDRQLIYHMNWIYVAGRHSEEEFDAFPKSLGAKAVIYQSPRKRKVIEKAFPGYEEVGRLWKKEF